MAGSEGGKAKWCGEPRQRRNVRSRSRLASPHRPPRREIATRVAPTGAPRRGNATLRRSHRGPRAVERTRVVPQRPPRRNRDSASLPQRPLRCGIEDRVAPIEGPATLPEPGAQGATQVAIGRADHRRSTWSRGTRPRRSAGPCCRGTVGATRVAMQPPGHAPWFHEPRKRASDGAERTLAGAGHRYVAVLGASARGRGRRGGSPAGGRRPGRRRVRRRRRTSSTPGCRPVLRKSWGRALHR